MTPVSYTHLDVYKRQEEVIEEPEEDYYEEADEVIEEPEEDYYEESEEVQQRLQEKSHKVVDSVKVIGGCNVQWAQDVYKRQI